MCMFVTIFEMTFSKKSLINLFKIVSFSVFACNLRVFELDLYGGESSLVKRLSRAESIFLFVSVAEKSE